MQDNNEVLTMEQLHEIMNEYFANNEVEEEIKIPVYEILQNNSDYTLYDKEVGYFDYVDVLWLMSSDRFYKSLREILQNYLQSEFNNSCENLEIDFKSKVYDSIKDKEELENCSYQQFVEYQWNKNKNRICSSLKERIQKRLIEEQLEERFYEKWRIPFMEMLKSGLTDEQDIDYLDNIHEAINNYCDANFIPSKLRTKINQIFEIDFGVATGIIRIIHSRYILNSDANLIVDSRSQFFERKIGIKPIAKEFISFLCNKWFAVNSSEIKRLLHEFMVKEEFENNNSFQDAKNIFQQTLSIKTTSAPVEEGKEVEKIIKDEVNGTPCIEFDNLFGADIARKNEVWQYMKLLGMIDNEGKCLHPEKTATIRAFVVVMRKNFKLPFAKSPDELIKIFGLKLSISDILRVRPATEIELKEQEIVSLINAFETKTLPFT